MGSTKSTVPLSPPCYKTKFQSGKQKSRYVLCDVIVLIPSDHGYGYQLFGGTQNFRILNFELDSNVFLRQNTKTNLPVLHDKAGLSAVVEEQSFQEILNSDILLKYWPLEFLPKRLHGLRIGGRVTQPSRTCGKEKNPCCLLESNPGLQKHTYKFTDKTVLVGNNVRVKCLSFWDSEFEGHVTNLTVILGK